MDYDDNFEMSSTSSYGENKSPPRSSSNGTTSSKDLSPDQLVDMVMRRLGHTHRPPYRQQPQAMGHNRQMDLMCVESVMDPIALQIVRRTC